MVAHADDVDDVDDSHDEKWSSSTTHLFLRFVGTSICFAGKSFKTQLPLCARSSFFFETDGCVVSITNTSTSVKNSSAKKRIADNCTLVKHHTKALSGNDVMCV